MKKNIIFRIIACIILCATLFGSFSFLSLNKETKAAQASDYHLTECSNTAKICNHTSVYLIVANEKVNSEYSLHSMGIEITSNNGTKYSHIHKHIYSYVIETLDESNKDEIYTKKNGYHYRTSLIGRGSANLFFRSGKCYVKPITQAKYSPTPTSQYALKWGFQKCSECALNRTAPDSTITFKCPCCHKTASINPFNGIITY